MKRDGVLIDEIDVGEIYKDEVIRTMEAVKNSKAGGIDGETADLLKTDMVTQQNTLKKLFIAKWNKETVPVD
jgi:hypothetical protein